MFSIFCTRCACLPYTNQMNTPWTLCTPYEEQPIYSCIDNRVYATIIGSFNYWKVFTFENSLTSQDEVDEIHKAIIDGFTSHM